MIDARRYAKLGGTRAEQTASIGSDFASVTGKQTNSSTPELRLGIDPEGGVQSAPRDFFHSCAARGSPSHDRARYARPCRLYVAGTILRYQITRLQSLADDATSTDVTSNEWLRAKPIHPSIHPCAIGNSDFFSCHDFHDPHDPLSLRGIVSSGHSARI